MWTLDIKIRMYLYLYMLIMIVWFFVVQNKNPIAG